MINLFYRIVLFEKVQQNGDCSLTGMFADDPENLPRNAVKVIMIQEVKQ